MGIFRIYIKNNISKVLVVFLLTSLISYINYKLYHQLRIFFSDITEKISFFDRNIVMLIILSYLLLYGISTIYNFIEINLLQKGVSNLLNHFMNKVFYGDDVYTLEQNASSFLSKANMSCNSIAKYYTSIITIISTLIILIVYAVIIIKINKTILFFCVAMAPLLIVCTIGIKNKIAHYQSEFFEYSKKRTSNVLDAFDNIKNIKVKNEFDFFMNRILDDQILLERNTTAYSLFYSYFDNIINFIISLAPILIIYLNIRFFNWNIIESDELLILFIFIPLFLNSFASLYNVCIDYFKCKPYLNSYQEICEYKKENNGSVIIEEFNSLEVNNVLVQLDNKKSIKIPNMRIKKGEKVLLVGESGVGKTTLFNILLGFIKNYQGKLCINDINLKKLDIKSLRDLIGVSFQNSELFSLSLNHNISLGDDVDIDSMIDLCQLNKLRDKKDSVLNQNELSGGEKSRISLAQNLVRNSEVILIDESFSSLDGENERLIMNEILKRYSDKTIICISHKLSLKEYFDRWISFT